MVEAEYVAATAATMSSSLDENDIKELTPRVSKRNCNSNPAVEIKGECWNINFNCRAVAEPPVQCTGLQHGAIFSMT